MKRKGTRLAMLLMSLALAGCATTGNDPKDPFEGFNRAMFEFNDGIDRVALKPAAEVYKNTLPSFVQAGVENFFGNLGDVWTAVNNLLQGKPAHATTDVARVVVNSTIGLGGLIDVASAGGVTKHNEDFGQTLGVWGIEAGPYIVLPFLGSSTLRDTAALPAEAAGDPWNYKEPVRWRIAGTVLRVVDQRAAALDLSTWIEDAALDRYQFVRDAYLQRRQSKVYDGDPPPSNYGDDYSADEEMMNGNEAGTPAEAARPN